MKWLVPVTVILVCFAGHSFGAQKKAKHKDKAPVSTTKKHLSTDVSFEDMVVRGQYQYPDEASATVEDEKGLDDLLQVRKDFKDRLKQTSTRR